MPQKRLNYKAAARTRVLPQIREFRDRTMVSNRLCPISGKTITKGNCAVAHLSPLTFDRLLLDFTEWHVSNPLEVLVGSDGGA